MVEKKATITNTVKKKKKNEAQREIERERERDWDKLIVYHTSVCVNGCEERKESERVFDFICYPLNQRSAL